MFLSSFSFPGAEKEYDFLFDLKTTFDQSVYPYGLLPRIGLNEILFRPVTILCGNNGCGKSTVLNVIAEKLHLQRAGTYNKSRFFERFVSDCDAETETPVPENSRIISSDDVFDMMLDIRSLNEGIDRKRENLAEEYYRLQKERFRIGSLDDLEHLQRINRARGKTYSRFIAGESGDSLRERSNGESALMYFKDRMEMDTLCLLDEPENSLSPENQLLLADFLTESVRYCGNQLIISTHSPFLLALPGAKIIDLDGEAQTVERWTDLKSIRTFYEFFKKHTADFENHSG